jgi:hypothetical protein
MENALDAMKMGFAMMVFVMALTASMYLLNTASSTSQVLLYYADETNYLDNIEVQSDITKRTVNVETIIPTLYRYYKENFAVQIYNKSGDLVQIFDVNIEGKVRKAAGTTSSKRTGEQKALMSLYGKTEITPSATNPYLFEAPWIGNTSKDIKTRIDLYVGGKCAYINGTKVDYTQNNLGNFASSKFEEQFIEYAYKGDTITSDDGTETITGNSKPENKIVIIYREID